MRISSILMLGVAVGLASAAGMMAKTWLEQQRQTAKAPVVEKRLDTTTVVVATQSLRFGSELANANLREIEWPAGAIPAGAFASLEDLLKDNQRRVVLSAIAANEPILKWKITGPGQRASLSSVIKDGMKAVTVRVNDVNGIAGFVLPGDRVDVLLTRTETDTTNTTKRKKFNDVILQHVRVLGVDQLADDRSEKPVVAKAVTLEVKIEDAQRLMLASDVGSLALALRSAGSTKQAFAERITAEDLGLPPVVAKLDKRANAKPLPNRNGKVVVMRGIHRTEYSVPLEHSARAGLFQPTGFPAN